MREKVIIIGGGISGLSTAHFLAQADVPVLLMESREQVGGNILTSAPAGFQIEHGPNSTLHKPGPPKTAWAD